MNKLEQFTKRLEDAGLSERQIDEAVAALNEYMNEYMRERDANTWPDLDNPGLLPDEVPAAYQRAKEFDNAQQGSQEDSEHSRGN